MSTRLSSARATSTAATGSQPPHSNPYSSNAATWKSSMLQIPSWSLAKWLQTSCQNAPKSLNSHSPSRLGIGSPLLLTSVTGSSQLSAG